MGMSRGRCLKWSIIEWNVLETRHDQGEVLGTLNDEGRGA
jgi:hypothetical protein